VPRIADLLEKWKKSGSDDKELTRRLIDLFFVSVLLDAGAGDHWKYVEPGTERSYERSEGIAVASLYMFLEGGYTGENGSVPLVDGTSGLLQITWIANDMPQVRDWLSCRQRRLPKAYK
jgi:hypothetical protein